MYNDEREITADKLIEIFESRIKAVTDIPGDARLVLMMVVIISLEKRSKTLSDLSIGLMQDPKLTSVTLSTFNQLLQEAKSLIEPGGDSAYFISHLAAKIISLKLGIDYRHPKLIAALVGTIQSTLSIPLLEALPNTSELSLGLLGERPNYSFPMFKGISEHHNDLIKIRLATNNITANFVTIDSYNDISRSTILLDSPYTDTTVMLDSLKDILKFNNQGNLIIIQNWTRTEATNTWIQISTLIKGHGEIEAIINFSSLPNITDHCTAVIINTNPTQRETLYIDVSMYRCQIIRYPLLME